MTPAVSVIVVSWNTRELLERCLRSLASEFEAGRAEVCVVDNASSDGSADAVRHGFPWVRLLEPGRNLGFGPAVNAGANGSTAPWLVAANADIELVPGALQRLLASGDAEARAGALAPSLIGADGRVQHSVYAFPTVPFTALFNLGAQRLSPGLGDRLCLEGYWNPARRRPVDWAIGAFLLLRRRAFHEVGGFDERQWMYAEDLDLGWRLARAGWQTIFEPGAEVRHLGAASTRQAWGDGRTSRWQSSTYAWMLRRRGLLRTRSCAALNVMGAAGRWALMAGDRARAVERAQMRAWAVLHLRTGFASRRTLEAQR